ncbi:MAG: flagellar hook-associated protein FlgK [Thermodesulfobacteriota bacterium]
MGLTTTFSIAVRGLSIARAAIEVVSHNIANVNTDGYSRQKLNIEAAYPYPSRYGPVGTGVDAENITRMYDRFIGQSLIDKNSTLSKYEAQKICIDALEALFNESEGNGINEALSEFWSAWQEVADNPEGSPQRLNLLEKATTLSDHIRLIRQDMDALKVDINRRVEEAVSQVNVLIREIADLNEKIVAMETGHLQNANDLRDQRDEHIKQLAAFLDINYYEDPANGSISVLTTKGTPLVMENSAWGLKATRDDYGDIHVEWERGNGGTVDITENITNGKLGGYIEMRDQIMRDFYLQFEAFTEGLIKEVNRQHAQGVGLATFTDLTSTYDLSEYSSLLVKFPGEDNDIQLTALSENAAANKIGIKFVKAAGPGTDITLLTTYDSTTGTYNITVTLPVNANGNVTATAEDVIRAINEDQSPNLPDPPPFPPTLGPPFHAGDLVQAAVAHGEKGQGYVTELNDPDDPMRNGLDFLRLNRQLQHVLPFGQDISYGYTNARMETELTGDDNDLVFTALTAGAPGEEISIEYIDPGAANSSFSLVVDAAAKTIKVYLETDSGGYVVTKAEQIADAINSDPTANTLVKVERVDGQSGAGLVAAMPRTFLDRSGSFDLICYSPDGLATVTKIHVNPTDTQEDIINQIGTLFNTGIQGLSAELIEDTGRHYIRIKADEGYSFAFGNDNASALMALGFNTFFEGDSNATIKVNDVLLNDMRFIAAGRVDGDGRTQTGDNTNALDLADLKDKFFTFRDQTCTISESYNTLLADVGATTHNITRSNDFNQTLVDQISAMRDNVSAVNLDEEMADLMKFQYMYQASAKLISVTDELLQTLLSVK